ncbi:hypothetical protein M427DRAFT_155827 [Gonapodya prolifera JEL478]|uniref:Uncharacterized protein n=1 Tax=Gonapodya prolifera (strain JEL478) TaxID=1344416 RepID=A0A139AE80_GONPJ|nr:hypothetical protein M427DRAFT_155827 [Gonapodya prolifera JEL478]|eukprot:KXS14745.1 hypothetical protein M427DRAFT_155827 [Gonapodya prolifera JEL478]
MDEGGDVRRRSRSVADEADSGVHRRSRSFAGIWEDIGRDRAGQAGRVEDEREMAREQPRRSLDTRGGWQAEERPRGSMDTTRRSMDFTRTITAMAPAADPVEVHRAPSWPTLAALVPTAQHDFQPDRQLRSKTPEQRDRIQAQTPDQPARSKTPTGSSSRGPSPAATSTSPARPAVGNYPAPKQPAHRRAPPASAVSAPRDREAAIGLAPGVFIEPPVVEPWVPRWGLSESQGEGAPAGSRFARREDVAKRSSTVFPGPLVDGGVERKVEVVPSPGVLPDGKSEVGVVLGGSDDERDERDSMERRDEYGLQLVAEEETGEGAAPPALMQTAAPSNVPPLSSNGWNSRSEVQMVDMVEDDGPHWELPFEAPSRPGSAASQFAPGDVMSPTTPDEAEPLSASSSGSSAGREDAVAPLTPTGVSDSLLHLLTTLSDLPGEAGKNFAMARRYVFNRVRRGHRLTPAEMGMLWSKVRFEELPSKELDLAYDDPGVDKDALMECVSRNLAEHLGPDADTAAFEKSISSLSPRFFAALVEYATGVEPTRWSASEAMRAVTAYVEAHPEVDDGEKEAMWGCVKLEELSTGELERAGTVGVQVVRVVEVLLRRARSDSPTPHLPDRSTSLRRARSASPRAPITPPPSPPVRTTTAPVTTSPAAGPAGPSTAPFAMPGGLARRKSEPGKKVRWSTKTSVMIIANKSELAETGSISSPTE